MKTGVGAASPLVLCFNPRCPHFPDILFPDPDKQARDDSVQGREHLTFTAVFGLINDFVFPSDEAEAGTYRIRSREKSVRIFQDT